MGETVTIKGWVDIRRDQGKMIFFDFRDMTGYVQGVVLPNAKDVHEVAAKIRPEWVVEVEGKINARPEKNIQKDKQNGSIELEILKIAILNESQTPPIDVRSNGMEIGEESRLTYRYLDLRRPRMQKNIRNRHAVTMFVRNFLSKEGFTEIETPNLPLPPQKVQKTSSCLHGSNKESFTLCRKLLNNTNSFLWPRALRNISSSRDVFEMKTPEATDSRNSSRWIWK